MKITVNEMTARLLKERLKDEQPGSPLTQIIRQIDLAAEGNRMLTAAEMDAAIVAVVTFEHNLGGDGNPAESARAVASLLKSAAVKLQVMADRQREREA